MGLWKELVTAVPSAIRMRSRPPEGRLRERSAYEGQAQGRVHGRERIVNRKLSVNDIRLKPISQVHAMVCS